MCPFLQSNSHLDLFMIIYVMGYTGLWLFKYFDCISILHSFVIHLLINMQVIIDLYFISTSLLVTMASHNQAIVFSSVH